MSARQFNLSLNVSIDPDVWEGTGYDPLNENPAEAARQVAAWFKTALYMGSDHLPVEVGRVEEASNPGRVPVYPSAEISGLVRPTTGPGLVQRDECHVITLVTRDGEFVAKNAEGQPIGSTPRFSRAEMVGPNYPVLMRLFSEALDKIDVRTPPKSVKHKG